MPAKLARKGARWRPTIFAGGHQSGSGLAASARIGAAELVAQVARLAAGQEQAAKHGPERLRPQVGAGGLGNRLGRGVGELGGDAALLDREVGDVAGGVDVVEAADARVRVDRDEAVARLRQPVETWALQARQRDDAVDLEPALGHEPQRAVCELGRMGTGHERDAAFVEELADGVAAGTPKELQRLLFGRDEHQLDALDLMRSEMRRGHQRQFVERQ